MIKEFDAGKREHNKTASCMLTEAIFGCRLSVNSVTKEYKPSFDDGTQEKLLSILEPLLDRLNDREKLVLSKRFGFSGKRRSYAELAAEMDMSEEDVRDIEAIALRRLRHPSRSRSIWNIVKHVYANDCTD